MKVIGLAISIVLLTLTVSVGVVRTAEDEAPSCNCFLSDGSGGRQYEGNCYAVSCEWKPIVTE